MFWIFIISIFRRCFYLFYNLIFCFIFKIWFFILFVWVGGVGALMYGLGVSVLECVAWGCRCLSGMGVFRSWFIFVYFQDLILFNFQDLIGLGGFRSWYYELSSIPLFTTTHSTSWIFLDRNLEAHDMGNQVLPYDFIFSNMNYDWLLIKALI